MSVTNSKKMQPESLMMSHGHNPENAENSVKPPIFQTSTFVFESAEQGKRFFQLAYGLDQAGEGERLGNIYSRVSNPNLEILEKRLALWDGAEDCAVFSSGMAAITSAFFELLKPGDLLLHGAPVYGGTDHFITKMAKHYGIGTLEFKPEESEDEIGQRITGNQGNLIMIYVETPPNPTSAIFDHEMC